MFGFTEVLVPIAFFGSIIWIVYLVLRRKERMALINKGLDASVFEKAHSTPQTLKWGMLLIGIGVGIIIGKILYMTTTMGEEESFFSMIFIFGGLALVWYHFIASKIKNQGEKE